MYRRDFLKALAALAAAGCSPARELALVADETRHSSASEGFSYAALKGRARALAGAAYAAPSRRLPPAVKALDWDQYQALRFRPEHALWAEDEARFRIQYFHLGLFFETPVRLHEVVAGRVREIAYEASMFDYDKSGLDAAALPADLGFAGFRIYGDGDWQRDIAAFLGASYYRAVGGEMQYGASARGLAIDCGMDRPEEFPTFTAFWFERPAPGAGQLTVHALLDSPSVAGAYRFVIQPGKTLVIDVDAALYPRAPIERLGIAPLTSMFEHAENDRRVAADWRPEIHDSDGLALWTGEGEWLWRPLTNPAHLRFNAYLDRNPRGFGLLQRDRDFDHYQDDGVFYDRRPSVWIEPRGDWGPGSVHLVELPTPNETEDNIVAYWNPAQPPQPGDELLYGYRVHWGSAMPAGPTLAHVVATRTGIGGVIGRPRRYFSWRFAVDFAGGSLARLRPDRRVEAIISASHGELELVSARPLDAVRGYRAMFDLRPPENSEAPINLRLFLAADGEALSETWLYQWTPPPIHERR